MDDSHFDDIIENLDPCFFFLHGERSRLSSYIYIYIYIDGFLKNMTYMYYIYSSYIFKLFWVKMNHNNNNIIFESAQFL